MVVALLSWTQILVMSTVMVLWWLLMCCCYCLELLRNHHTWLLMLGPWLVIKGGCRLRWNRSRHVIPLIETSIDRCIDGIVSHEMVILRGIIEASNLLRILMTLLPVLVLRRLLLETVAHGLLISLMLLRALIAQILILIGLQVELIVGWRAMWMLLYILCVVLWPVNRLELVWVIWVIRVRRFIFKALSFLLRLNRLLRTV